MKTMNISTFKTHALKIIDKMPINREPIIITKRGKPFAELIPIKDNTPVPGKLAGTIKFNTDITKPLDEKMWDACK